MKISAIVPCYNEEENLDAAIEAFTSALSAYEDYEIIITDDGSTDRSLEIIKRYARENSRIKYISFSRNFGNCAAFRIGYRYAKHDWCIQYDCDLQSPPEESQKLTEKLEEGYDVVFGTRSNRGDPLYRVWGTKIQQFIAAYVFGVKVPFGASVFRAMRTAVARDVVAYPSRSDYFIATVPLVTHHYTCVETKHNARRAGISKWTLEKMLRHSFDLFLGFSVVPLSLISFFFLLALALVGASFVLEHEFGVGILSVLFVFNLLSLAILAEYIKRPFSRNLPYQHVYVRETNIPACQEDFQTRDLLRKPASRALEKA